MDWHALATRPFSRLPKLVFHGWRRWALAAATYVGLLALGLVLGPDGSEWRLAAGHGMLILPHLLTGGLALLVARRRIQPGRSPLSPRVRQAWGLLGLSQLLWLGADLAWLSYVLVLRTLTPVPSVADPLYVTGYFFAAAAFLSYLVLPREQFGRIRLMLDVAVATGAIIGLSWMVLLRPIVSGTSASLAHIVWTVIYPVGDLALLLILLNVFLISESGRPRGALNFVALGLVLILTGNLAYFYMVLQNQPDASNWMGLAWLAGSCALGLGALYQREQASQAQIHHMWFPSLHLRHRIQTLLPLAATVVLGWYTVFDWRLTGHADLLGMWATISLGLALVARQGVVIGEGELGQYAHLVNSVADPAFICGANGRLRLVNPAFLAATGYEHEEEVLGRPLSMLLALSTLHPDEDLRPERMLEAGWSGEVYLHRRDGSEFPAYLSLRPVLGKTGARRALAGTAHDLTQVKQQQESLRAAFQQVAEARRELETLNAQLEEKVVEKMRSLSEANAQLAEANAQLARQNESLQTLDGLKSEFVSLVSHEMRAPLTTVSGGIELLLADPSELSPHVRDSLALVQNHLRRLTQFVETILDLSALEAGRLSLYPGPLAMDDLIEAVRALFASGRADGDRLRVRLPANVRPAVADERALTSVLFHLIDNALKYAPGGEITLELEDKRDWVQVHVCDQGPGIPLEMREKIFTRFERLNSDDARSVYGHGLGLYMSRRLLREMGGDIEAGSAPGGGARFTFWLPAMKEEEDHAEQQSLNRG